MSRFHGKIPGFLRGWTGGAEAGGRKEEGGEKREEGLVCGGSELTGCLACSRDKDVAHSLPDGRGRKEGGAEAGRTCSRGSGRKAAGKGGEL